MMRFAGLIIALSYLFLAVARISIAGGPGGGEGGNPPPADDLPTNLPENAPAIRLFTSMGDEGFIESVVFSPDGRIVVGGSNYGKIRWFDAKTGRPIANREKFPRWHGGACRSLVFSPDGRSLLVSTAQNELSLLDVETERPRLTLEKVPPATMVFFDATAFSPDGKVVAGSLGWKGIALWDAVTGRLRTILPPYIVPEHRSGPYNDIMSAHPARVMSLAFTPDNKSLLSDCGIVQTWDVAAGREVGRLEDPFYDGGSRLALSPDGRTLARRIFLDHDRPGDAGRIDLWDRSTGKRIAQLPAQGYVAAVAFLPDGKSLVSLEDKQLVRLWDVATGKQRAAVRFDQRNNLGELAVSPDGKRIAAAGEESALIFGIIQLLETDGTTLRPWKPQP